MQIKERTVTGSIRAFAGIGIAGLGVIFGAAASSACQNGQIPPNLPQAGGLTVQAIGCVIEHYKDSFPAIMNECNISQTLLTDVTDLVGHTKAAAARESAERCGK